MRLKDKVILVTGSATGIGEAIAKRVVSEGGLVVVHGLEENLVAHVSESLNEYAGNCRGEQSVVAVGLVEDLTVQGCPERLVRLAVDSFGRLDGLVNNAAVVTTGDISTTDYETLSHTLAVNTVAPLVERQSYVLGPAFVTALKDTVTEKGITTKNLLMATANGAVYNIPR